MEIGFFINFNGNCRQAVTFYAGVFGKDVPKFITYGETGISVDKNVMISDRGKKLIAYSSLYIHETLIEFSDMPDNFEFMRGNSFALALTFEELSDGEYIFEKLSENGTVIIPLSEIPGQGFLGTLADRFGIMWNIKIK